MLSACDVAEYFLTLVDSESGDVMTHMKLQKLLYYAQGFHLALFDEPLFAERIVRWMHGPVVPDVYHQYKRFGAGLIPAPESFDSTIFDNEVSELLDEVYNVYGQFSALALRNLTHQEPPWLDAADGEVISHDSMRQYFKTRLA